MDGLGSEKFSFWAQQYMGLGKLRTKTFYLQFFIEVPEDSYFTELRRHSITWRTSFLKGETKICNKFFSPRAVRNFSIDIPPRNSYSMDNMGHILNG